MPQTFRFVFRMQAIMRHFLARYFSARLFVTHAFTLSQAATEAEAEEKLVSQQRKELPFLLAEEASRLASGSIDTIPMLLDGMPHEVERPGQRASSCSKLLASPSR